MSKAWAVSDDKIAKIAIRAPSNVFVVDASRVLLGVIAMRDAWDAALQGIAIEDHAKTRPALAAALEAF